ncbi:transposase [uncultured Ilyobacter sp.]|uniref:transposase n=1 Tax=uncultured Ilyobacter sp. TaxID=544433 RepID=UPI0029C7396C|nr:transposase [uncultured Ilyobacter sp.]
MTRRRYSMKEKERILEEVKLAKNRRAVAAKYNLAESTIRGWEKKLSQKESGQHKDLSKINKTLEAENKALKEISAEKDLEIKILKDMLKKM